MWVQVQGPQDWGVRVVESIPFCLFFSSPQASCCLLSGTAPWDSYLLTLYHHGCVYFHLKVNIQRLVAQYICLNNWGEKSKGFFQAGDFHLLGVGLCYVSPRGPGESFLILRSPGH